MMAGTAAPQVQPVNSILDDYLTREEFAREIGVSPRTLGRWEDLRIGPPVTRIGRTPYYNKPSARAWLKAQEVQPVRDERRGGGEPVRPVVPRRRY